MTVSDHVFQLIKSLSKSEKRYFKLFVALQGGEKNYLRLFDAIDNLEKYDEAALSEKFKGERFANKLAVTKNYLQELILRSMRAYHDNKSVESKLNNLLLDAGFLEKKSLYKQSDKLLVKAQKLAEKYGKLLLLIQIIHRRILLMLTTPGLKMELLIDSYYRRMDEVLEDLIQERNLQKADHKLFVMVRQDPLVRDSYLKEKLEDLAVSVRPPTVESHCTFQSRLLYYKFNGKYYRLKGDLESAHQYFKLTANLWEQYPHMITQNTRTYKTHLSNYLGSSHTVQDYEKFPEIIQKIRSIPSASPDEEGEVFANIYFYELLYHMNYGELEEAASLVPEIRKGFKRYQNKVTKGREISYYYNITIVYFVLEAYEHALHWLNKIIHDKSSESRQDLQSLTRILQLIFHFELRNYDILDYLFQATYRHLQKRERLYDFEKIFLRNFKKIAFSSAPDELAQSFAIFETELQRSAKEGPIPGREEIKFWVSSKSKNISMKDLYKLSRQQQKH